MAARSICSMCEGRALLEVSRGPVLLPRWRPSGCQFDPRGLAQLCCKRHEHIQAEFIRLAASQVGHPALADARSEEHTSELQSLMRISYAVFCLKKKKKQTKHPRQ